MFRSLYAKIMTLFLAVLLFAMIILSALLYQNIRNDKIDARLSELKVQARDIAYLTAQTYTLSPFRAEAYLMWKSNEIMREFDAVILIFDKFGQIKNVGDGEVEIVNDFMREETLPLLNSVINGAEIALPTVHQETGNLVFTVGVPFGIDGNILGGVFIHTSEQSVEASYQGIFVGVFRALMITLAMGSVLVLVVCRLITRPVRAMAQAAERFSRGDFEQRVRVETRDEIGRLAESFNSMAEDLDRLEQTRREFVANVSHELRSPLTSMQGFIQGILDGTVPEGERTKYLMIVLDETRRLGKLISTLLDLSRIESGQTPLNKTRFDINEAIARVLIRQESRISEREIEVKVDFLEENSLVNADADRIEQVIINLIDNAIKYCGEDGCITLATSRERDRVTVSVGDNGPGIPPEALKRVFDRFYMAEKAHTSGTGMGLGLSIAKGIIDQHGQKISVASEPGNGTAFSFTLEGA